MSKRASPVSTWELVLYHRPSEEDRGVGVQPHALIHTPHHIFELCVVLHCGLLSVSQHLVNLLLSLQADGHMPR